MDYEVRDLYRVELELIDELSHPAQEMRQVVGPIVKGVGKAEVTARPAWVGHRHSVGDDRLLGQALDNREIMKAMDGTYGDELVRRLRLDHPLADIHRESRGRVTITWAQPGQAEPIVLRTSEADLAAAVDALGADCRDALWPTSTVESAGFNLLLVHLDETIATRPVREPLVITPRGLRA